MDRKRVSGFTLVELIVVIAIIGLFSAVALASLGSSRNKSGDAGTLANVRSLATQAEIYFLYSSSYGTQTWVNPCTSATATGGMFIDKKIKGILDGIYKTNRNNAVACAANGASYVVVAQLVSDSSKYQCIDSRGISRQMTTVPNLTGGGANSSQYISGATYGCYGQ